MLSPISGQTAPALTGSPAILGGGDAMGPHASEKRGRGVQASPTCTQRTAPTAATGLTVPACRRNARSVIALLAIISLVCTDLFSGQKRTVGSYAKATVYSKVVNVVCDLARD